MKGLRHNSCRLCSSNSKVKGWWHFVKVWFLLVNIERFKDAKIWLVLVAIYYLKVFKHHITTTPLCMKTYGWMSWSLEWLTCPRTKSTVFRCAYPKCAAGRSYVHRPTVLWATIFIYNGWAHWFREWVLEVEKRANSKVVHKNKVGLDMIKVFGNQVTNFNFEEDRFMTIILHAEKYRFPGDRRDGFIKIQIFREKFFHLGTK